MTAGPDGTPTLDEQKFLSTLTAANPILGYQKSQELSQQHTAMNEQKMKSLNDQVQMGKTLLNQVRAGDGVPPETSQGDWTSMLDQRAKLGLSNDHLTAQFPGEAGFKSLQAQGLSIEAKLDQQNKDRDFGIKKQDSDNKKQELAIERYKTFGGDLPTAGAQASATASAQGGSRSGAGSVLLPPSQQTEVDPAQLVRTHVPPALQSKAFDEIEAAQNTAQNAPKILASFDKAASNLHAADFVPGMDNADQKSLHALMGPTFKDVEGTVRQAAMDNMNKNTTPAFGDDANTIATKRAALEGYLKSKSSAATAKGFGIDLTKFPSTNYSLGQNNKTAGDAPILKTHEIEWK